MRNSIGQEEFASIVTGVLEAQADVQAYTIKDKGVYISICASVRREKVDAFLDFDDRGAITGRFSYAQTAADAQKPREIGSCISGAILCALRQ
ncbi:MAG: hypothetical protein IKW76_01260 [Clostridia bacterium]|nr:hypothetical protein [Clostridia bacterium]